jgi:uncharacterized protein YacL
MSFDLILRLSVMIIGAFVGWELAVMFSDWVPPDFPIAESLYRLILTFSCAFLGFIISPYITTLPYRALRDHLHKISARSLIMGVVGLTVGLVIAALLALPLSLLPGILGKVLPFLVAVILGSMGAGLLIVRDRDIVSMLSVLLTKDAARHRQNAVILDTSVIIDGRVADVSQTGFITGTLIVPRFVLDELQHIADSADVLRRNRGRRGLDILNKLQKDSRAPIEIVETDFKDIREVDSKLVRMAQEMDCPILTNDYNLNRVAELQGVKILNINELANAIKAVVLPGEILRVQIIQDGKELGQGVGYLDDGTMIVVEEGRRHINSVVEITVTRVLQTVAGRMIFGQLTDGKRQ